MYFDDEATPEIEAPGAKQRATALAADPERQSLAAIEFDALARTLVAKGISYGQSRGAFMKSLGDYWDTVAAQFGGLMRKHKQILDAGYATAPVSSCEHVDCKIAGPHEHVTGGPVVNPDAKPMRDSAGYPAKDQG